MCIAPVKLSEELTIRCRECWRCRKDIVHDWVGRAHAESRYSQGTYSITLTYADEAWREYCTASGAKATTLVYKDVQLFLKRLRKEYGKIRYIVTGEYGSRKGRAHWHIILFFKDKVPDWEKLAKQSKIQALEDKRFELASRTNKSRFMWSKHDGGWGHGFVHVQNPDWQGLKYALKYILKEKESRGAYSHLAMSKKPPLGYQYFDYLADLHVEQGIAPTTFVYKFDEVRDNKYRRIRFMMQGKTRDNFLSRIKRKWAEKYGEGQVPNSELFEEWEDKNTEVEYTDEEILKRIHYKPVKYIQPEIIQSNKPSFTDGEIIELEYGGNDLLVYKHDKIFEVTQKTKEFFEGTWLEGIKTWRVEEEAQKRVMLERGKIKRRQKYAEILLEQSR